MTYRCLVCQSTSGTSIPDKKDKEDWFWTLIQTQFGPERQFGPFCKESHVREFLNAGTHRQAWFLTRDNDQTEALLRLKHQHASEQEVGRYQPHFQTMFLHRNPEIDQVIDEYDLGQVKGVATNPNAMTRVVLHAMDVIESDGGIALALE